jgi:hypothetical protein
MNSTCDWETDGHHVWPRNDLKEHILEESCWCRPCREEVNPDILIHNSMDRREEYERGRKIN